MSLDISYSRYFRPTEVETLLGDPTKAKEKLAVVPLNAEFQKTALITGQGGSYWANRHCERSAPIQDRAVSSLRAQRGNPGPRGSVIASEARQARTERYRHCERSAAIHAFVFLGLWERINNPNFKGVEFDAFRNQAGTNSFTKAKEKLGWVAVQDGLTKAYADFLTEKKS